MQIKALQREKELLKTQLRSMSAREAPGGGAERPSGDASMQSAAAAAVAAAAMPPPSAAHGAAPGGGGGGGASMSAGGNTLNQSASMVARISAPGLGLAPHCGMLPSASTPDLAYAELAARGAHPSPLQSAQQRGAGAGGSLPQLPGPHPRPERLNLDLISQAQQAPAASAVHAGAPQQQRRSDECVSTRDAPVTTPGRGPPNVWIAPERRTPPAHARIFQPDAAGTAAATPTGSHAPPHNNGALDHSVWLQPSPTTGRGSPVKPALDPLSPASQPHAANGASQVNGAMRLRPP